jgi:hypothetical protein
MPRDCLARGRIERASYESVAVRYLCANHHPDHDTIATFRRENQELFRSCFVQVLLLAREMGVLRVGAVSVDGTRLAGAGSKQAVRGLEEIERELESLGGELLQKAEVADANDRDAGGDAIARGVAGSGAAEKEVACSQGGDPGASARGAPGRSGR